MTANSAELIPIKEAAALLGLGVQTLYNYRSKKKGPASKVYKEGNRKRIGYRLDVIEAWVAAQAAKAAKPKRKRSKKSAEPKPSELPQLPFAGLYL